MRPTSNSQCIGPILGFRSEVSNSPLWHRQRAAINLQLNSIYSNCHHNKETNQKDTTYHPAYFEARALVKLAVPSPLVHRGWCRVQDLSWIHHYCTYWVVNHSIWLDWNCHLYPQLYLWKNHSNEHSFIMQKKKKTWKSIWVICITLWIIISKRNIIVFYRHICEYWLFCPWSVCLNSSDFPQMIDTNTFANWQRLKSSSFLVENAQVFD